MNTKKNKSEIQVDPDHYSGMQYDNKVRWISYWHQIDEIIKLKPKNILEIGIGNGVVSRYLKNVGIDITTMDIDERLEPDKVGSVLNIPYPANSFETSACFEVLEHIPYENFKIALCELKRVATKNVLISLPDRNRVYRLNLQLPRSFEIKKLIHLPRITKPVHKFDGQHYWEVGKKGFPLKRIKKDITDSGLTLIESFRVFEYATHRFFRMSI